MNGSRVGGSGAARSAELQHTHGVAWSEKRHSGTQDEVSATLAAMSVTWGVARWVRVAWRGGMRGV
jgi:hypothetical protein